MMIKNDSKWLTALHFVSSLIMDSLWAFVCIAIGIAYACTSLGVPVEQVIRPGGGQVYFLMGTAVFFVLIGQGFSWLIAKLGERGGDGE